MAVAGLVALVVAVRIGSDDGNDGEENNGDLHRKDLVLVAQLHFHV